MARPAPVINLNANKYREYKKRFNLKEDGTLTVRHPSSSTTTHQLTRNGAWIIQILLESKTQWVSIESIAAKLGVDHARLKTWQIRQSFRPHGERDQFHKLLTVRNKKEVALNFWSAPPLPLDSSPGRRRIEA